MEQEEQQKESYREVELTEKSFDTVEDPQEERKDLLNNNGAEEASAESPTITYWTLIRDNRPFCFYLASYVANHIGEWLTYLSSLTAIHAIHASSGANEESSDNNASVAVSYLVVVRLMTNVLMYPIGGVLADGFDRRKLMIAIDILGAMVAWLFVVAVAYKSVALIYLATFLQEVLSGLYEPSRSAILPLMTGEDDDQMQKATILTGMAWSAVAAFGSAGGGFLVALIGMKECFVVDSMTYLVSALFMFLVGEGRWNVSANKESSRETEQAHSPGVKRRLFDLFDYLSTATFAPIILFKFSGLWLTLDVVNVSFSEQNGADDSDVAFRLGLLFGAVGVGCFVGPVVAEEYTRMEEPSTIQRTCIVSIWVAAFGCLLMGIPHVPFWLLCIFTGLRATGIAALWINSELILQKFSRAEMLGRVFSIDYALALIAESSSATAAGILEDDFGLAPSSVCIVLGIFGVLLSIGWTIFHIAGGGVASVSSFEKESTESTLDDTESMDNQDI